MKLILLLAGLTACPFAQAQYPGKGRNKGDAQAPGSASYRPSARPAPAPLSPAATQPDISPPATRPAPPAASQVPATRPGHRPGTAGGLPSQGGNARPAWPSRPETRPAPVPQPSTRPSPVPERPGMTRPGTRPIPPATRPAPLPAEPERPTARPLPIPERPVTRPVPLPGENPPPVTRPVPIPGRPTTRPVPLPEPVPPVTRPRPLPEYPTTKPWPPEDDFIGVRPLPGKPGKPVRPQPPVTWPDRPVTKPVQPGINRPPVTLPIHRPARPLPPPQVTHVWQNHTHVWNQWTIQNNVTINNFVYQRPNYWQPVHHYWHSGQSWQHYGRPDWWQWHGKCLDYRRLRCEELWNAHYTVAAQIFDLFWWEHCPWAGRPVPADMPNWWWFEPVTWEMLVRHLSFGRGERSVKLLDPGVHAVIYGDTVYIQGQAAGPAYQYAEQARQLSATRWNWEPPYQGGRFSWLPLGVWALAPQEQGEATMFLQLSISREGFISGAYTNVLTGDDLPVSGMADLRSQRVAWTVGSGSATVMETSLPGFTWDVAGAFLHFYNAESQNWLLTRLPSPGAPPGAVRLPADKR